MTKANDGQINIKASAWPSFMYDEAQFDEDRVGKGLCRGYFLVRVRTTNDLITSRPHNIY
jgi:hypothetical protein